MIVLLLTLHVTKIFKDFMIVTIIYYILKLLNTNNIKLFLNSNFTGEF